MMKYPLLLLSVWFCLIAMATPVAGEADAPTLILHSGRIVTVDEAFAIHEAVAVRDGYILAVGADDDIVTLAGPDTHRVDLRGLTVLPGLMDSHAHPAWAAMYEFHQPIPAMNSVPDVLAFVRRQAEELEAGEWIRMDQIFITRLREQRYPTREELDEAAPHHPVMFRTGPDAMVNSLALQMSGIDRELAEREAAIERDPQTGEPTGLIRNGLGLVRYHAPESFRSPNDEDRHARITKLLQDYASVGLTAVADRTARPEALQSYAYLLKHEQLPVRVMASHFVDAQQDLVQALADIDAVAEHPLRQSNAMLRIVGIKVYLDGGMLTGSAYMREPWGVSEIYDIDDPAYRGLRFIPHDQLVAMVRQAVRHGMQFTAHSVGDGAVHALLEAYEQVDRDTPLTHTRPCITHSNFMSAEAIQTMARLGIVADIQPAWLWLDGHTLLEQFGEARLQYFQPLKSLFDAGVIVGGGSDHMQRIGSMRSINPYNPWLGMWIAMARQPRELDQPIHPEQRLSREEALRFYTTHNARVLMIDDLTGSIEPGKFADMIVIDRDYLQCPLEEVPHIRVMQTYVAGRLVHMIESADDGITNPRGE